jgi:tetratricopeptide (TPR) repeat protein
MSRQVSVFIAAPSDLATERQAFRETVDRLNEGFGDGAGMRFVPLGWEDALATTGRRPQSVINEEVDRCDIFVLVLNRRWGQSAPDSTSTSYTEEEYERALQRFKSCSSPTIWVFFKEVDPASLADPGQQLKKVMRFRRNLERSCEVLYRTFADENVFARDIDRHLREYSRGKASPLCEVLPINYQIFSGVLHARSDISVSGAWDSQSLESRIAEKAAKAVSDGRFQYARELFAEIATNATSLDPLMLCWAFYRRFGDIIAAHGTARRMVALAMAGGRPRPVAVAQCALGFSLVDMRAYQNSVVIFRRVQQIGEQLQDDGIVAEAVSALGSIAYACGQRDRARALFHSAIDRWRTVGCKEGQAQEYANLAQLASDSGDHKAAEDLHHQGLSICEEIGNELQKARHLCNLGLVHMKRGEIDVAEGMYQQALEIDTRLGWKKGVASHLANLALLQRRRGNAKEAVSLLNQARGAFEDIGDYESADGLAKESDGLPIM